MTAPLHERLLQRADMLIELGYGGCDKELREAAAALRPPEGEVGALCERLEKEAQLWERYGATDLRAALAHLRRLGQVAPATAAEPDLTLREAVEELREVSRKHGVSFPSDA